MAFVAGRNSKLLIAGMSFSAYAQSGDVALNTELPGVTTFVDAGVRSIPTLFNDSASLAGVWDDTASGGPDSELDGALGLAAGKIVTVGIDGLALGAKTASQTARTTSYTIGSTPADAVRFAAQFTAEERIDIGVSLHDLVARTSTGNGSSHDGAASSSGGGVGTLHVTAVSGSTPSATIKVQHSADDSSWADLVTFTAATGVTSQRVEVAGTVNRYLRAQWTISGTTPSFTFHVNFARR